MSPKQLAIAALGILEDGRYWHTIPLMERCGETNRQAFRAMMDRLRDRGVVAKLGGGKFRWKLLRKDYNRDNPLLTPKSTGPLAHLSARLFGTAWVIGGDTFPVKDRLAALGCIYGEVKGFGEKKVWYVTDKDGPKKDTLKELGLTFTGEVTEDDDDEPARPSKSQWPAEVVEAMTRLQNEVKDLRALVGTTTKQELVIKRSEKKDVVLKERVHPVFAQVMFHINCGDNVMLVGPKGCGKTWLAEQVAKALEVDFGMISLSGGITESKLFGRVTPNVTTGKSEWHPAPFAEFFEKSGVFLLDEVDAADPNVLLSLNSGLANGVLTLDRPKNPMAKRHPGFVCIAAANTWGNGADRQYVGRNQQDGAFVERFVALEMGYDEELERALCPGQEELVRKLHFWRKRVVDNRLERTISTRFIVRAYNWLKHGKDLSYVQQMLFAGWRPDEMRKVLGG